MKDYEVNLKCDLRKFPQVETFAHTPKFIK